jgi:hypothetical protein
MGTITATQTPGDCKQNQCDGNGNVVVANSSIDTPADDGNQCTAEVCNSGVPAHPAVPVDTACTQNGGFFCSSAATCVQCNAPTQCSGNVSECATKTCDANTCGVSNLPPGTPIASQVPGDCKENECDGNGSVLSNVVHDSDLPVDGNQCTNDVCTNGVPSNPSSASGTSCTQNGGTACDGAGTCVSPPAIVSTTPANGATGVVVPTSLTITFSTAMNPATLTTQIAAGACSGSLQLSTDNFVTCLRFSTATAAMTVGNTVATITPAPAMSFGSTLQLRVTTAATSGAGIALPSPSTIQFVTATDVPSGVVISQLYVNGGVSGGTYANDFVELHNRGSVAVAIGGWSVQYTSPTGTTWNSRVNIPSGAMLNPGAYYLVMVGGNGAGGGALPAPDATNTGFNMGQAGGKVALVASTNALTVGCPLGNALVVDFVGYGTANCWENLPAGGVIASVPSSTAAAMRKSSGCQDNNDNGADFQNVTAPVAKNSSTLPALICPASTANEQNIGAELDYCVLQFPTTLTVAAGGSTGSIYAQAYEAGSTEAAGAATNLQAQIGYGPVNVNPENQSGWLWFPATFGTNQGNNDEWSTSFTAPATGSYRYTARFSYDGLQWTYCDVNGAGSNPGLNFEANQLGTLTVP